MADLDPQRTDRVVHDLRTVGSKENQVAVDGAGAREDCLDRVIMKVLDDRRLQAVTSLADIVDLDIGQTLGAVNADELGI